MEREGSITQSRPAYLPTICYCDSARRLLEAFGEAVRRVIFVHEMQFHTILDGDADAGRFDVLIHEANEAREDAKYAYLSHLHVHGCSTDKWKL